METPPPHAAGPPALGVEAEAVVRGLRSYAGAVDTYLDGVRGRRHLNRSDLTALAVVMDQGTRGHLVTPTDLGKAVHLSTSATSSMIDRLERSGHLTRRQHPDDRRSVVVEVTDETRRMGGEIFGRLGRATVEVIDDYSPAQLRLIAEFLERVAAAAAAIAPED